MCAVRKYLSPQLSLPLSPVRNSNLFSNHWLEHRLPLEPEWNELRQEANEALDVLLSVWESEHNRVEKYGDEAGLEHAFIQPVLQSLGWKLKYQTFLQSREPDYALFTDGAALEAALGAGRRSPDFWKYPTLLADAKAWHISLDRPTRLGKRREYPPEQIEWYLDRSRLEYGILTNGRLWRLIPRDLSPAQPRFQTYLEVNLPEVFESWRGQRQRTLRGAELDDFLRFYLLFSPHGHHPIENRSPLIARAIKGSSEYSLGVSEKLKERVFEALRMCIEGFLSFTPNKLSYDKHIELCRQQSLILLYRLLFIMYAEDRGLLPYRVNRTYTRNRSLARHRDEMAERLDRIAEGRGSDFSKNETTIWADL